LKIVPSSSFFFVRHTGKEGTFSCCGSPSPMSKNTAKSSLFFLPFFVSFLFFCLFYFLISPIKKIIPREEGRIFFRRRPLFFFVCVFSCLSQQQHKKGIAKYLCAKAKKATLFFLGFAQKARKRSALKKKRVKRHVFFSLVFLRIISLNRRRRRRRRYKKLHTHLIGCVRRLLKTRDRI
jgi:hypothetical protein